MFCPVQFIPHSFLPRRVRWVSESSRPVSGFKPYVIRSTIAIIERLGYRRRIESVEGYN